MQLLAIDYGSKRCGIAITDDFQLIASALATIETTHLLNFLQDYCSKNKIEAFIIGQPRQMNGQASESERLITPFLKQLAETFPSIPIRREDERFTSKIATQSMLEAGYKKKQRQNKTLIDQISAVLILQNYMQSKNNFN